MDTCVKRGILQFILVKDENVEAAPPTMRQVRKGRELAELHGLSENNVNQIVNRTKKTFQAECERLRAGD